MPGRSVFSRKGAAVVEVVAVVVVVVVMAMVNSAKLESLRASLAAFGSTRACIHHNVRSVSRVKDLLWPGML